MSQLQSFIIGDLKYPIDVTAASIAQDIISSLNLPSVITWEILRRSLDARDKERLQFVWQLRFNLETAVSEDQLDRLLAKKRWKRQPDLAPREALQRGKQKLKYRPVIVGSGPAGLFCAYRLAQLGLKPLILERGRDVDTRAEDVEAYWSGGPIDPVSNVQFGEGGAGTFSDGKLTSRSKNPLGREILEIFHKHGAADDILWKQKAHIGTDVLREVVKSMRMEIESLGGCFQFETQMQDLLDSDGQRLDLMREGSQLAGLATNHGAIDCELLILAIGHSARDTYRGLIRNALEIIPKSFAVGMRIEHPQASINLAQYGAAALSNYSPCSVDEILVPAEYQLTHQVKSTGRGIYSFCMCPGGVVVESSSAPGQQVVNGMSYRKRDQANANSAILCTVGPNDYGEGVDAGLLFQEDLERRAWLLGQGLDLDLTEDELPEGYAQWPAIAPVQLLGDYLESRISTNYGEVEASVRPGQRFADLNRLFPPAINDSFKEAFRAFGRKLAGFDLSDAVLTAVESRTSSPLRLLRDKEARTASRSSAIYPIGEGSGYAGGIVSAAVDGLEAAEAIARRFASF